MDDLTQSLIREAVANEVARQLAALPPPPVPPTPEPSPVLPLSALEELDTLRSDLATLTQRLTALEHALGGPDDPA